MSIEDVSIRVKNVSKHYFMFNRPADRLWQSIVPRVERGLGWAPRKYYREFKALQDVSFRVLRGETVGIVGRNGSGKSTLLQIVCGTMQPSSGTVEVNGRVAALLELGAGFNPEFTGRENVYLNTSILGLTRRETDARFDEIARFADIGEYLDQPVKTYSSGMYTRLAFAAAISVEPDILIVDEALAVGDEAFQRKCYAHIEGLKERGGTILFVSHSGQTVVQLCQRAILLDHGELLIEGRPKTVIHLYQRLAHAPARDVPVVREQIAAIAGGGLSSTAQLTLEEDTMIGAPTEAPPSAASSLSLSSGNDDWLDPSLAPQTTVSYDRHGGLISDGHVVTQGGRRVNTLQSGREYIVRFQVKYDAETLGAGFGIMFKSHSGLALAGMRTGHLKAQHLPRVDAGAVVDVAIRFRCAFAPGVYFITLNASAERNGKRYLVHRIVDALAVRILSDEQSIALGYFDIDARLNATVHS